MKKLDIPKNCQIPSLEEIYNQFFFKKNENYKGTFIEIGAFDGISYSNTYCLSKEGWSGIYIEPIFDFAQSCIANHSWNPNITVINAAIVSNPRDVEIHVAGSLTTTSDEMLKAYNEIFWAKNHLKSEYKGKITVKGVRLDSILKEFDINELDLLVIDVEGSELDVLESFDLKSLSPKIIICEIEDDHQDFKNREFIFKNNQLVRKKIEDSGYQAYWRDEINTVFIRTDEINN